ncbi:glycosyltransferase family 4 protein [Elusimicrobiota bacterium]
MILIFQRILTHYRLPIFKAINGLTGAVLCIGKNGPSGSYLSKVVPDFKYCQVKDYYLSKNKDTLVVQDILTPLIKYKPKIIVIEFALCIITNWIFLLLRPVMKYKLIIWSHGYNRKKGFRPEKYLDDKLRLWWMNKADAVILYSETDRSTISRYINDAEKVFVAQNTLDTKKLIEIREELEKTGKENIKKEIKFKEKYNLIYVGRLIEEKQVDRLINVFKILSGQLPSLELHIVGDGPLMDQLRDMAQGLKVNFSGTITDERELGKLLFASDMMVVPGYMGLSIVHSFCFNLAVVSQRQGHTGPFHSPEIEYLIDGKTGFLVENNNNEHMAKVIREYLIDREKQNQISNEIRKMVEENCNLDNMIKGFTGAFDWVERER